MKYLVFMFGVTWCSLIIAQKPETKTSKESWINPSHKLKYIYLILERLNEPIYLPKGIDRNVIFHVPHPYMPPRYQKVPVDSSDLAPGMEEVDIKLVNLPDLTHPSKLGWRNTFSPFIPLHREYAVHLIDMFMGMENIEDFISATVFCRERMNPHLLVYALSVAMAHRNDTGHLPLPSIHHIFPEKFMDRAAFPKARREVNVVPQGSRVPIQIPVDYTASNLDPEHRCAYFREDVGVNLGHWYWHINYPSDGPPEILKKDRSGELFYYYHEQILARYDFERLCNGLRRVERLIDWHKPIKEAYFPKLDNTLASKVWPSRQENCRMKDIDRKMEQISIEIQGMIQRKDRIYEAIHQGAAFDEKGRPVSLADDTGINTLGWMVQSTALSVNRGYYGDLHDNGHVVIAYIHDPEGKHLEDIAVMGDTAVAMRDPIFYRWHRFINGMFQEYKDMIRKYSIHELDFPGVTCTAVEVISKNGSSNEFFTYWEKGHMQLAKGMDFAPGGSIYAEMTHLQHKPFVYHIEINNAGPSRKGTVRIFMAPKYDERGQPMFLRDQRHHFIELDHFPVQMYPGTNKYERHSFNSSITFPMELTFTNLNSTDPTTQEGLTYCGCGWPHHMLIPKGTPDGYPAELFVMVTDFSLDNVEQPPPEGCRQPHNYCGWRKRKYPDKRPMGYPFDRNPQPGVSTLTDFMTPNMRVQNVKIIHKGNY